MTVRIDYKLCNGCPKRAEGFCEEICPGDLFFIENGKAVLREPADCWDCFACVKACPRSALSVELPFQISEAKHRLTARVKKNHIVWRMFDRNGNTLVTYTIPNRKGSLSSDTTNSQTKNTDRESCKEKP
jgi:adenylylsulfate reductase subunit B